MTLPRSSPRSRPRGGRWIEAAHARREFLEQATPGHTAWHFPDDGVVATGDALVTAHPVSAVTGEQLLDPMFHHDPEEAERSLAAIRALDAAWLYPGHGPAVRR